MESLLVNENGPDLVQFDSGINYHIIDTSTKTTLCGLLADSTKNKVFDDKFFLNHTWAKAFERNVRMPICKKCHDHPKAILALTYLKEWVYRSKL